MNTSAIAVPLLRSLSRQSILHQLVDSFRLFFKRLEECPEIRIDAPQLTWACFSLDHVRVIELDLLSRNIKLRDIHRVVGVQVGQKFASIVNHARDYLVESCLTDSKMAQ